MEVHAMTTKTDTMINIRLPSELLERMKVRADAEERTVAGLFRYLARSYLETGVTEH